MIGWVLKKILGTQNQREVRRLTPMVGEINRHEEALRALSLDAAPRKNSGVPGAVGKRRVLGPACCLRRLRW